MNYRRVFYPGALYFFTINLKDRKNQLLIKKIHLLRLAIHNVKEKYPFDIQSIVVLPDHFHMLIKLPANDNNYPLRIRLIKSMFSYQIPHDESISQSRQNKNERGIWQRRYWEHLIQNEKDYEHHVNYILYNPVKHGYVKSPVDWPFSSIHRDIKREIIPINWTCSNDFPDISWGEKL